MTPEMIEAAAKAGWDYQLVEKSWDDLTEEMRRAHQVRARDMLAAAEAVAWQPIETAPKNGDILIVGFFPNLKLPTSIVETFWNAEIDEWMHWDHEFSPTHWRPLPAAPSAKP